MIGYVEDELCLDLRTHFVQNLGRASKDEDCTPVWIGFGDKQVMSDVRYYTFSIGCTGWNGTVLIFCKQLECPLQCVL